MLFLKEMKKTVVSVIFLVFLVAIVAFAKSQNILDFSKDNKITPPRQGEDYGSRKKEVPEQVMPAAFASLCSEFAQNGYTAYPIGFYKRVKLNGKKQGQMAEILAALSGIPAGGWMNLDGSPINWEELTLEEDLSYEEFKGYMKRADGLIGGGSKYSEDFLPSYGSVPVTFWEAREEYLLVAGTDRFTGAYARYFCDYFGIILSVLPVFFAVSVCLQDRKAGMCDLVYARKISSFKLVVTRYLAVLASILLPVVILSYVSSASVWGIYGEQGIDYILPLKYVAGWLMPSVMVAAAVGMFFTELTGTPVAVAIQAIWWFVDINSSVARIDGKQVLFQLIPRHNSLGGTQIFLDNFQRLAANRVLCAGAALALVLMTVIIYGQKRRGKINGHEKNTKFFTGLADRKGKPAA